MKWTTALSRAEDLERAIEETVAATQASLGAPPDLVFLFASEHHSGGFDRLPAVIHTRLECGTLLGCSASGVIAGGSEIEQQPALGLTAGLLPDVALECWQIEADALAPGTAHSERCARLAREAASPAQFVILADPFSFPTEQLLRSLESAFASRVIAGGLASGGQAPGEVALFLDTATYHSGALMLALSGDVEMTTAVAQGCRPIGEPMFLSAGENGKITKLDGRPPMEVLNALYQSAGERDRALMEHSLFVGIAMRAGDSRYAQGDFLIRNVMGADPETGAIWVAADLHENQIVQFHLRDATTSAQDLDGVLARLEDHYAPQAPAGALLFSCTGRGQHLYGQPDHDSQLFRRHLGTVPLGGFFCNGEIGPVQGSTFLHGYTSAFALFRPRAEKRIA